MDVFDRGMMADRVVLVTGGATGIGMEIARAFGEHGARVCIASRKAEILEASAEVLRGEGIECMWAPCDIREYEQVEGVISTILDRYDRLDVVVNNAAGNFPAPITGLSPNGFKAVVDIDLRGTYHVTKAAFEAGLKERGGQIVNISAPFEGIGVALQAHAAAAKAGVDSLTRTCAVEFGPHGVRVNAVAPGATGGTEGMARLSSGRPEDEASCPLGYVGSTREIANVVLFLCSEAASYVTGQIICVDGGSSVGRVKIKPPGRGAE